MRERGGGAALDEVRTVGEELLPRATSDRLTNFARGTIGGAVLPAADEATPPEDGTPTSAAGAVDGSALSCSILVRSLTVAAGAEGPAKVVIGPVAPARDAKVAAIPCTSATVRFFLFSSMPNASRA